MLDHAIRYHNSGLTIIPIAAGSKRPTVAWKAYQTRRPSEATVRRWFNGGAVNVAAVMRDGIVCRDYDDLEAFDRWAADHLELARVLPTVATGRPGRHVYCRGDIEQVKAASASGGSIIVFDDGELRGGGYCILPPSTHPNGTKYEWIIPLSADIPVVDLHEAGFLPQPNGQPFHNRQTCYTEVLKRLKVREGLCVTGTLCVTDVDLEKVAAAIHRTLPAGPGQRHRSIFALVRELKAIDSLANAPFSGLEPYVREWHTRAIDVIATKDWASTWGDFIDSWPRVRFPAGEGPLSLIVEKAAKADPPVEANHYGLPEMSLLAAICRELQRASGNEPFCLSARAAARSLGTNHMRANRLMRILQTDGILRCVTKGERSKRRASEYLYLGDV